MSVTKTMYVKENSFRKLDDPFNSLAKKYVFYVKICDVLVVVYANCDMYSPVYMGS